MVWHSEQGVLNKQKRYKKEAGAGRWMHVSNGSAGNRGAILEGEPGQQRAGNDMAVSSATLRNEMAGACRVISTPARARAQRQGLLVLSGQPADRRSAADRVTRARVMRCSPALTTSRKSWHRALPRRWPPSAAALRRQHPSAEDLHRPLRGGAGGVAAQPQCWL